jgi:hypothetical protein
MPVVPQPSAQGIVRSLGFNFDFTGAFSTTATQLGIPVNTSFSTLQTSLGVSTDTYPTQQTAWGRANQAYTRANTNGNVPLGLAVGQVPVWNGTEYAIQGSNLSLRLGTNAAETNQGTNCVAVGTSAGRSSQGSSAVALGFQAGADAQGATATALGDVAGRNSQGIGAVAIGSAAGNSNQGINSIAIGVNAGQANQGSYSIAIGRDTGVSNQAANSIILNASGGALNATEAGMYVNPIRNVNSNFNWLTYNSSSREVTFDTLLPLSLGASTDAPSLSTSVWAYAKQAENDAATAQTTANRALVYNLTGSTIGAVITNPKGIGSGNAWTQNTWYQVSQIVLKIPPNWTATDSVIFDGWLLYNFQGSGGVNTYWGVSYFTNTYATPTDILGSTTTAADSLYYPTTSQQYIATNIIIPPTNLTAGGTITLRVYGLCGSTGTNYLSVSPVIAGRVGVALN